MISGALEDWGSSILRLRYNFAGGYHDFLGFCCKVVDGGFPIQSSLDAGDDGVALDACLLDSVQTFVEVDELAMHLSEVLAEIGGEVVEQLLHGGGGGVHGSSGL